MTTDQELKLFRALRLLLRIACVLLYNQIYERKFRYKEVSDGTIDKQYELQSEASRFERHEL